MDLSLDSTQQEFVNLARELVIKKIRPACTSASAEENPAFDWELVRIISEHNLLCPTIPHEYGGLGLDRFTTALIIEEISTGSAGLAAVMDATLHAVEPILLGGTDKQKEDFLLPLTGKNAGLAGFALTESSGGSDLALIQTRAERTAHGFVINGSKDYIINAPAANFISLVALTSSGGKKASMRLFLLPAGTPGFTIVKVHNTSGLNYAPIADIKMENALLSPENVLKPDEAGSGYLLLTQTFDLGRAMVGATSVGIARAAYEAALNYAENRIQFGTPIKKHQAVAYALADMATKIEMARLMTWKACWLIDKGGDYTVTSAMAKIVSSTIAQEVTCAAADILGARGYEKGSPIEQMVRDARALSILEGTNNIQRNLIASLL